MILRKFAFAALLILPFSIAGLAQTGGKSTLTAADSKQSSTVKASPAYAELLLRKVERESELEEFALDYTDEFPKVKEIKFELESINREMNRLSTTKDAGKLSLALGKLLVRKTEVETDLWNLQKQYKEDHAEVRRARRKIEVFERAIKEILQ